jgi:hypothetical protein
LLRDDGAVVYLNGREAFRSNMPTGTVEHNTLALSSLSSESLFFRQDIDPGLLVAGTNVVAVEVHQASQTSSDLSFNLELSAAVPRLSHQLTSAHSLLLFWTENDVRLEVASDVIGPWEPLPDAVSPVIVNTTGMRFYRLRSLSP